jgi:hypothetical protein
VQESETQSPESKQNRIPLAARWLLPTIGNITFLLVLYFLIKNRNGFLDDGDTGFHIRIGDLIRQTGSIPKTDPFSFTMQGHQWFAWEWLTDILMSFIHSTYGLIGVVCIASIAVCVVLMLLYRRMLSRDCNPFLAFFLTMLAVFVSGMHWLARPHLISWIFLSLACITFESYRRNRTRWIYLLPFLTAVWANMHGAFVLIFPMLVIYATGEMIRIKELKDIKPGIIRSILKPYILVGVLSALSSLATPYGWILHKHIWRYINDTALLAIIDEFKSPDFHTTLGKLVELIIFLTVITVVQAVKKKRWIDIGLLVLFTHLMLQSVRHIPLMAIVAFPIIGEHLSEFFRETISDMTGTKNRLARLSLNLKSLVQNNLAINRQLSGYGFYIIPPVLLFAMIASPWGGRVWDPNFNPDQHPVKAAEFIANSELHGNVYAQDEYGDYLIYRFYPKIKVFIDGRSDFYNSGPVLEDYKKLLKLDPSWSEVLDKFDVQWMLLENDDPLSMVAQMSGGWERIYKDDYSQILIKKRVSSN